MEYNILQRNGKTLSRSESINSCIDPKETDQGSMPEPNRRKALYTIGLGIVLMGVVIGYMFLLDVTGWGQGLEANGGSGSPGAVFFVIFLPLLTFIAGIALTVLGSSDYARTKGYSGVIGGFLSLLLPIGFLILLCLPDIRNLDDDAFIRRLTRAIRASKAGRFASQSANILGVTALAISTIVGILLPIASLVIGSGIDFWLAVGVVVLLPIIFLLYPLGALVQGDWITPLIVYGGLFGGAALIRLGSVLSVDSSD